MTTASTTESVPDFTRFAIGFDHRDRARLHALIDEVLDSDRWSEASMNERFEAAWEQWNEAPAVAMSQLGRRRARGAALRRGPGRDRAVPVEHVHGDAAGGDLRRAREVQFVDCNREDLCMSFADFEQKAERHRPRAAFLVHIGGHIAFDSERIAEYCRERGIFLIEDCAHAHGASLERPAGRDVRRRRRLLAVRDQDDLDRRGRRARLAAARAGRARARVSQLRQARVRGPRAELPDERVHRRARPGPDRADAGDRRVEERRRRAGARSRSTPAAAWSSRTG